jgi:hypothetical protein
MREVDGLPHLHLTHVVLELLPAIQADHVALAMRLAGLGNRRDWPGQAAVGTPEEEVQEIIDHAPTGTSKYIVAG